MVSDKIRVSQSFSQISQVSQSRFLRGSARLGGLEFFASRFGVSISVQRSWKGSVSQLKMLVSLSRKVLHLPCTTPRTCIDTSLLTFINSYIPLLCLRSLNNKRFDVLTKIVLSIQVWKWGQTGNSHGCYASFSFFCSGWQKYNKVKVALESMDYIGKQY